MTLRPLSDGAPAPACTWRRVQVDRWTVAGRVWEDPAQPSALPVVAVHGLVVSSRMLVPVAELLARRRPVYAPDLPGFGASARRGPPLSVPELGRALIGWMDALGLGGAVLLGNSFGCQVAVEAVVRRPDLAHAVVLAGPTIDPAARSVPAQLRRWRQEQATQSWRLRGIQARDYATAGIPRALATFRHALHDRIEDKLPRVGQPTLVVRGTRDPLVPQRWAQEAVDLLTSGRLATLPGATHAIGHEMPLQTARVIEHFLSEIPRPAEVSQAHAQPA